MFDSCSAYHNLTRESILFLSHCVPNPPDKGERIRAWQEIQALSARYRVHLACLARSEREARFAYDLRSRCASVHVEILHHAPALARAGLCFAAGGCLTAAYYANARLRAHVASVARQGIAAAVVYSSAMAPYVPDGVPVILDYVDVDSEKWFDYARSRGRIFGIEGKRLRRLETRAAAHARATLLCTERELALFCGFAPNARSRAMENGVDFRYFDPQQTGAVPAAVGEPFLVFVGSMNYYPNEQAACWFAEKVLPALRRRHPALGFVVVGRDPGRRVRALANRPGVTVTGTAPDVRPYLGNALAMVAPLAIARGIQNKVLESLAMGKCVFASTSVCETFGAEAPRGVVRCETVEDYETAVERCFVEAPAGPADVRADAQRRFVWQRNLEILLNEVEQAVGGRSAIARTA